LKKRAHSEELKCAAARDPGEQLPAQNKGSRHPAKMPTWADIEDQIAYWHRQANEPAWLELERMDEILAYFASLADDACSSKFLGALVVHDTLDICAAALRPELRLRAANRSTRQSQG